MLAAAFAGMSAMTATDANALSIGSMSRQQKTAVNTSAPLQFQIFCLQNPNECKTSRSKSVSYTPKVNRLLSRINAQVNRQIKPRNEQVDVWQISAKEGDCDDYVMTKRHRLIQAGIPASALRVAVVKTRQGEGHAVLIVKTNVGDLILDNLRKNIVARKASGYRYIKISTANPLRWR